MSIHIPDPSAAVADRSWVVSPLHDDRILQRPYARRFLNEAGVHGTNLWRYDGSRTVHIGAVAVQQRNGVVYLLQTRDEWPRPGRPVSIMDDAGAQLSFAARCKDPVPYLNQALAFTAGPSWRRMGMFGETGDVAPVLTLGELVDAVNDLPYVDESAVLQVVPAASSMCAYRAVQSLYRLGFLVGGKPTQKIKELLP